MGTPVLPVRDTMKRLFYRSTPDGLPFAPVRPKADLHGIELVVDLRNVTAINPEAESVLLQLIREKVKFQWAHL